MGPAELLGEADADAGQAGELGAVDVDLAGDGEVGLPEPQLALPREVRVGEQQPAAVGRAVGADRPAVRRRSRGALERGGRVPGVAETAVGGWALGM